jgi:hypothetical protein
MKTILLASIGPVAFAPINNGYLYLGVCALYAVSVAIARNYVSTRN